MQRFAAREVEVAAVSVATMGDGLFLISLLSGGGAWVSLSIRAQARGALCCQPATVHQDDVKTGSLPTLPAHPPHPRP